MKITVVCPQPSHPVFPYLARWTERAGDRHEIVLTSRLDEAVGGDVLFLISCDQIVDRIIRSRYQKTLVVHSSDLPEGRGWSPQIWQILEGRSEIVISLLEAEDKVDSGDIWLKETLVFKGHELFDEINEKLYTLWLQMLDFAVDNFDKIDPQPQPATGVTYYRRRTPEDSELDPKESIESQFDLLRVADPLRYPAFVRLRGHKYEVLLKKVGLDHQTEKD